MKEKIAKIGWKNIVLVVLAVLLVISASQLHTLRKEYKKVYSQNMELNSKMAELKEKNASLEAQIQSEERCRHLIQILLLRRMIRKMLIQRRMRIQRKIRITNCCTR